MATKLYRPDSIEVLDTATGEVIARTDFDSDNRYREIAFSPGEDQAALWSGSRVTIWDIMHPNNRASSDPWLREDVWIWRVAFQTCNDLVIGAIFRDYSGLLQVWHWQDHTGFERTYSLDFITGGDPNLFLAPDGLTILIVSSSSTECYSWNHHTARFHPVHFDDQVYIYWPKYSPDGSLFACWSRNDSQVRIWGTRTRRLVSKFPMAHSPTLIQHSPGERLIALRFEDKNTIHILNVYTGLLYTKILGRGSANMAFIQDGTKLAHYHPDFGLRIQDLMDEHWHSTHGYELTLQGMADEWVMGRDNEPLFWVPVEHRVNLYVPSYRVVIGVPQRKATSVDLSVEYSRNSISKPSHLHDGHSHRAL